MGKIMDETSENNVNIHLGDIIEIEALGDMLFHNIKFFVKYIDIKKIVLVSEENDEQTLLINEEGGLSNENISGINILHREKDKGYAKQNGLTVGTWIDIHFNTNVPMIITGQITNLDEDQIEIRSTNEEVIYIDFAYKGIPIDLPIEKIITRDTPITSKKLTPEDIISQSNEETKGDEDSTKESTKELTGKDES